MMDFSDGVARDLLDAAPDPSIVIDADGRIRYANERVRNVLGYEPVELIGQYVEILLPTRFLDIHPQHRIGYFNKPAHALWDQA